MHIIFPDKLQDFDFTAPILSQIKRPPDFSGGLLGERISDILVRGAGGPALCPVVVRVDAANVVD